MEAIRAGLDAAGEMEAWAYDENGWPSGFADGTIPPQGLGISAEGLQPLTVGRDSLEGVQVLGAYRLTAGGGYDDGRPPARRRFGRRPARLTPIISMRWIPR